MALFDYTTWLFNFSVLISGPTLTYTKSMRQLAPREGKYNSFLLITHYNDLTALRDIKRVFNNRLIDFFGIKGVL